MISRVEEQTDWCAGMVVVSKPSGEVCICVVPVGMGLVPVAFQRNVWNTVMRDERK